jgi:hypothetical protein
VAGNLGKNSNIRVDVFQDVPCFSNIFPSRELPGRILGRGSSGAAVQRCNDAEKFFRVNN